MDENVMIRQKNFLEKVIKIAQICIFRRLYSFSKKIFFYLKCVLLEISFFAISSLLNNFVTSIGSI